MTGLLIFNPKNEITKDPALLKKQLRRILFLYLNQNRNQEALMNLDIAGDGRQIYRHSASRHRSVLNVNITAA